MEAKPQTNAHRNRIPKGEKSCVVMILEILRATREPMTTNELTARVPHYRKTVYKAVRRLCEEGFAIERGIKYGQLAYAAVDENDKQWLADEEGMPPLRAHPWFEDLIDVTALQIGAMVRSGVESRREVRC